MVSLSSLAYYTPQSHCLQLIQPDSVSDLVQELTRINRAKTPYFKLGAGTNSLIADGTFPGAVFSFSRLSHLQLDGQVLTVGAGVSNTEIAARAQEAGLKGAGWMYRLPGQIGATTRMNARCFGGEISKIVRKVVSVDQTGVVRTRAEPSEMFRGYKDTIFMENHEFIVEVEIVLEPGDPAAIQATMERCLQARNEKMHFHLPSCGCVFKNNYSAGVPSGALLQRSGVYDLKLASGLQINPRHANFLFNKGAASHEILQATFAMRELVWNKAGVWLEYEMEVLGQLEPKLQDALQEHRPSDYQNQFLAELRHAFKNEKL